MGSRRSGSNRGQQRRNTYLPPSVPDEIRREAERITRGKTSDYDRALAIDQHLKQNYTYTLEPPTLPMRRDAAEFFLFEARQGYCEQFANAMTVMLRSLDIPARIAVGYAPGEYDEVQREWIVREKDAHAWVEVFFSEYGWITFDPTGGVEPVQPGFSLSKIFGSIQRFLSSRQFLPSAVILVLLAAVAYAFKVEAYDRYLRAPLLEAIRRWRHKDSPDPREVVQRHFRQLQKLLRRRGVPYAPSQTPHELQEAFIQKLGSDGEILVPLKEMTRLYAEALYSDRPLPEGAELEAREWLSQVKEGLKAHARK